MKKKLLVSVIASTLGLTACGGEGGGGSSSSVGASSVTISGKVADGYLVGATVCLDINENKVCDAGEPTATTTAGGAYTLEVDDPNYPIVAEVGASTIDEDTSVAVGAAYVLSAPAGKPGFVSPLTTMVHSVLEGNPTLSADDAEAVVKSDLGYTADSSVALFEDYVAAENDTGNADSAEYERLHKIAQVVAEVMENNFEQIQQAAVDAGLDTAEVMDSLVAILTEQVLEQLNVIAEQADDDNALVEDIAMNTVGSVDTSTIAEDVEAEELISGIVAASIQSAVAGGVNWIEGETAGTGEQFFDRGRVDLNDAGDTLEEVFLEYDFIAAGFVEYVPDDIEYILGPNGLVQTNDTLTGAAFSVNTDGSATVSFGGGTHQEQVTMSSLDVSGQPVVAFLSGEDHELVAAAIDPQSAVFGAGSVVYRWTSTVVDTYYELFDCVAIGEFLDCATSLDQLVSATPWVNDGLSDPLAVFIGFDSVAQTRIDVELLADGTANYYEADFINRNPDTGYHTITLLTLGSWSTQTIGGETVMIAQIPGSLLDRPELSYHDSGKLVAVAVDGVVRQGEEIPAGEVDIDEDWTFNDAAMQSITDNFNP